MASQTISQMGQAFLYIYMSFYTFFLLWLIVQFIEKSLCQQKRFNKEAQIPPQPPSQPYVFCRMTDSFNKVVQRYRYRTTLPLSYNITVIVQRYRYRTTLPLSHNITVIVQRYHYSTISPLPYNVTFRSVSSALMRERVQVGATETLPTSPFSPT